MRGRVAPPIGSTQHETASSMEYGFNQPSTGMEGKIRGSLGKLRYYVDFMSLSLSAPHAQIAEHGKR
jgi:hypothetical protein